MRSDNNEILIVNSLKSDFKTHISTSSAKKDNPSIAALDKHLKAFKELGLIILSSNVRKEFYIVNPKYAYKGGKTSRLKLLKALIEEKTRRKEDLRGLIDQPKGKVL
jgi:DNA-binding transcriptional ArsR family regulator